MPEAHVRHIINFSTRGGLTLYGVKDKFQEKLKLSYVVVALSWLFLLLPVQPFLIAPLAVEVESHK